MEYEFKVYQMQVEEHNFWVAESKSLKGCIGQGETAEAAIQELSANEKLWLSAAKEYGIPIPEKVIRTERPYNGKISLRVSPAVHEDAIDTANDLGISLNQFINDAIITYIGQVRPTTASKKSSMSENVLHISAVSKNKSKIVPVKPEEM